MTEVSSGGQSTVSQSGMITLGLKQTEVGASFTFDTFPTPAAARPLQLPKPKPGLSRVTGGNWRNASFSTSLFIDVDLLLSASARELKLPPSELPPSSSEDQSTSSDVSVSMTGSIEAPEMFRTPESFLDVDKQFWGEGTRSLPPSDLITSTLPPLFQIDRSNPRAPEWQPPELPACDTVDISSIALAAGDDWIGHYAKNFYGKHHGLYVGFGQVLKTFVVAIRPKMDRGGMMASLSPATFLATLEGSGSDDLDVTKYFFVLIISQFGTQRDVFNIPQSKKFLRGKSNRRDFPKAKDVAAAVTSKLKVQIQHIFEIQRTAAEFVHFAEALAHYESRILANGHKFGLLYCKEGQSNESEYFRNRQEHGSPAYHGFLQWLGQEIPLEGYAGYAGGLDTKRGTTGTTTIVGSVERKRQALTDAVQDPLQIVFHVPTLMPFVEADEQAIERKRHVGNDIVCLVFQDKDAKPFDPTCVLTTFIHVYIVVRDLGNDQYQVGVINKDHIVSFGPPLPAGEVFFRDHVLRKWLYHKLVNAERAAFYHPHFRNPLNKSRQLLLQDLVQSVFPQWLAHSKRK